VGSRLTKTDSVHGSDTYAYNAAGCPRGRCS